MESSFCDNLAKSSLRLLYFSPESIEIPFQPLEYHVLIRTQHFYLQSEQCAMLWNCLLAFLEYFQLYSQPCDGLHPLWSSCVCFSWQQDHRTPQLQNLIGERLVNKFLLDGSSLLNSSIFVQVIPMTLLIMLVSALWVEPLAAGSPIGPLNSFGTSLGFVALPDKLSKLRSLQICVSLTGKSGWILHSVKLLYTPSKELFLL